MDHLTIKKRREISLWHDTANVFWSQFGMVIGIGICMIPCHFFVAYFYTDYAPWLFYNRPFQELALYNYYIILALWIMVPVMWVVSFAFGIAMVHRYIHHGSDSFTNLLSWAFTATSWVISTVWQITFAIGLLSFILEQLGSYAYHYDWVDLSWKWITKIVLMALFSIFLLGQTRYHSFGLAMYRFHTEHFRKALVLSKELVKKVHCKVRRYGFLLLGILGIVPLFFYGFGWAVDGNFYSIYSNPYLRLLWLSLFHLTFLLFSIAHGIFFVKLYKKYPPPKDHRSY